MYILKRKLNFSKILVKSNEFNAKMLKMYGKYENSILLKRKMKIDRFKKCLKIFYTSTIVRKSDRPPRNSNFI